MIKEYSIVPNEKFKATAIIFEQKEHYSCIIIKIDNKYARVLKQQMDIFQVANTMIDKNRHFLTSS